MTDAPSTPESAAIVTELRDDRLDHVWYTRQSAAALIESQDALISDLRARLAAAEGERDSARLRGDNHWETLRGIRDIARTSGDLERIILWVKDAGSGYVERPEATIAALSDRATTAEARVAELEGAVSWALGEGDSDFGDNVPDGAPRYWWRTELRRRARALSEGGSNGR